MGMSADKSSLILHPVRWRILRASASGSVTAQQLASALPDVPQATLYRHLNVLVGAGLLQVIEERKVRGTVERVYSLAERGDDISDEVIGLDAEEHMRLFGAFVSMLLSDYARYLDQGNVDLYRDGVGYRQRQLHLTHDEFVSMATELRDLVERYAAYGPGPGRVPRLLTTILMPAAERPDQIDNGRERSGKLVERQT